MSQRIDAAGAATQPRRRVGITDVTLRDGHQSLIATRLRTADMLPIAEAMDEVGFHSCEVWGGATFDSAMRFCGDDPWQRLQELRRRFKRTKLQMLLRGQSLVGYRAYADDVVDEFCRRAVGNGMDIIRVFDALNDIRMMERAVTATKAAGGHVQCAMLYTTSPVHDLEHYLTLARDLEQLGADSLCFKDMGGILDPTTAFAWVGRLRQTTSLPLQVHCHYSSGMAAMCYLREIEAGADVIDCTSSAMAMGTAHPPAEAMVAVLAQTPWATGLDLRKLKTVADLVRDARRRYAAFDVGGGVDIGVLLSQIPGGMMSNFVSQLAQQGAGHRLDEVLAEVPRVRADLGYPPLATPSSQIVGTQAVLNVLAGERYKMVTTEVRNYLRGMYGRPPGPVNESLRRKIIGDEPAYGGRPGDIIPPELAAAQDAARPYSTMPEDVLSVALLPQVALPMLQQRRSGD